jgi:hypothetical protein
MPAKPVVYVFFDSRKNVSEPFTANPEEAHKHRKQRQAEITVFIFRRCAENVME